MDQALRAVMLGLAADQHVFISIAKLRAARDIWARFSAACGAPVPARIEARSSGRMLTRADGWTNLPRLACAGFAAAVGGADAIVLDAFTASLGPPTVLARRLSRDIQLILMEESHLGRVDDPAGGSWFVEALTDRLARDGWSAFQAIEARGGIIPALTSGFIAEEIAGVRGEREAAVKDGRAPILGVTLHAAPGQSPPQTETAVDAPARAPTPRPPGADSRCPPLTPWRIAEAAERGLELAPA
jgi:methylmalonyl-CoA mutase